MRFAHRDTITNGMLDKCTMAHYNRSRQGAGQRCRINAGCKLMGNRVVRLVIAGLLIVVFVVGCQPAGPGTSGGSTAGQTGPAMSLAVDATDGTLLKAAGGLFRSTDRGQTWQPLPIPASLHPDMIRTVATTIAAPSSVYAAGPGAGVVRSDDRGQTWRT